MASSPTPTKLTSKRLESLSTKKTALGRDVDETSSITSMSSNAKTLACRICKGPERLTAPLIVCIGCKSRYHMACPNPRIVDQLSDYTCTRCIEKGVIKTNTATMNSIKLMKEMADSVRSRRSIAGEEVMKHGEAGESLEPADNPNQAIQSASIVMCKGQNCLGRPAKSGNPDSLCFMCGVMERHKKVQQAPKPAPVVAPKVRINKKILYPPRPDDRPFIKKRKRSSSGATSAYRINKPEGVQTTSALKATTTSDKKSPVSKFVTPAQAHLCVDEGSRIASLLQPSVQERSEILTASGITSTRLSADIELSKKISATARTPKGARGQSAKPAISSVRLISGMNELFADLQRLNKKLDKSNLGQAIERVVFAREFQAFKKQLDIYRGLYKEFQVQVMNGISEQINATFCFEDQRLPINEETLEKCQTIYNELQDKCTRTFTALDARLELEEASLPHNLAPRAIPKLARDVYGPGPGIIYPEKPSQNSQLDEPFGEESLEVPEALLPTQDRPLSEASSPEPPSPMSTSSSYNVPSPMVSDFEALERRDNAFFKATIDDDSDRAQLTPYAPPEEFDESTLDSFIFKQSQRTPVYQPRTKELLETQNWSAGDPRPFWPRRLNAAQKAEKMVEIEFRGTRKSRFGKILHPQLLKERADRGWDVYQTREKRDDSEALEMVQKMEELFGVPEGSLSNTIPTTFDGNLAMQERREPQIKTTGSGRQKKEVLLVVYPMHGGQH